MLNVDSSGFRTRVAFLSTLFDASLFRLAEPHLLRLFFIVRAPGGGPEAPRTG